MLKNNIIMEHQEISNLLNDANNSKFVTRKWITVNLISNYAPANRIVYNAEILKSYFYD